MEQSGMVTWLDRFMWEGICKTLCDWRLKGHKLMPVSGWTEAEMIRATAQSGFFPPPPWTNNELDSATQVR